MKQKIHAMATALGKLSHKVNGLRFRAVGQFREKLLTNRLSLRPSAQADASLITMTGEGEAVQVNGSIPIDKISPNSNDPSLPTNSALAVAVKLKNFLHCHCSNWRSGGFFWLLFSATGKLRSTLECQTVQSKDNEKKLLALPPAMRREDFKSKKTNPYKEIITTPFNSPVRQLTEVHWVHTYRVENDLKQGIRQFSKKPLTNRLSLRPSAQADASLITMTGEGEALRVNGSIPIDKISPNSNDHSLTGNSALAVAVKLKNFLHCHCSNWRSGGFFWLLFSATGKLRSTLECQTVQSKDNEKKLLAFPPAMRRGDFQSKAPNQYKEIITTPFNSPVRQLTEVHWAQTYRVGKPNCLKPIGKAGQKLFTNRLSLRAGAEANASLITMTGEGRAAVQLNHDTPTTQSHATGSAGPVKRRAGSWPVRMKDRFTLPFWFLFWLRKTALAILRAEKNQTITRKKELALPPAMRREANRFKDNSKQELIRESGQKQSTNRLSICPGAQTDASLITIMAKRRGIAVKLRPNILMALLIVMAVIIGKPAKAQTKALQIGDTIPEAVWNTPLQIVNHAEGKSSIRLGDYKGKLVILDFWATWCVNCVKSFPEEGRLQKEFEDSVLILPVTTQKQSIVNAFMQRDNPTKGSHLTVVTDDQLLSSTFKHQLMPHVVWIDGEGRFIASTAASYVQAEKIQQVLGQQKLNWTMKRDFLEFDKTDALMGWMDHGGTAPEIFGYSAFTGHLLGVDPVSGIQAVSESNSQRRYDINVPLQIFSVRAYGGNMPVLSKKQYLYQVSKIQDYVCPAGMPYIDWKVKHTYCYEAVLPGNYSRAQIRQKMREDLKSYFGLEGKLEYRKVGAWVFHKQGTGPQTAVSGSQSLASLIWQLNEQHPELPLAVDSTGSNNLQVPKMEASSFSLVALNKALEPYGISVEAEESKQPFFVLYESDILNAKPKQ